MTSKLNVLIGLLLFCVSCQFKQKESEPDSEYGFRPQYHFSPPSGWMNDPNGMVYFEGEYHLFYQHYPDGLIWGPMHWGHAVSTDLINWEHLPIALYPDDLGYIFSGSAVVDEHNTSGLGIADNPPLVAIYTYHNMPLERQGKSGFQSQGIAYSLDKGRTWTKYLGNPVLEDLQSRDFRDPKVIWVEDMRAWIMVLAVKDRVSFYSSKDLIHWQFESDFGQGIGAHGGVWECPDLITIEDETGERKWILLVSINPGGPNAGSATQYFIGEFDGHSFMAKDSLTRWVDYGTDNYAGVTWSGMPENDGRVITIGWMNNWNYANQIPESGARGAFTLPREFFLVGDKLGSKPIREVENLRKKEIVISEFQDAIKLPSQNIEVLLEFNSQKFNSIQIVFTNDLNENATIDIGRDFLTVNRSESGKIDFSSKFNGLITTPLDVEVNSLRVFVDRTSLEVFINDGLIVSTQLVFPTKSFDSIQLQGDLEKISRFRLYELNPTKQYGKS